MDMALFISFVRNRLDVHTHTCTMAYARH